MHNDLLDGLLPPDNRPHYPAALGCSRCGPPRYPGSGQDTATSSPPEPAKLSPAIVASVLAGGGHQYVPFARQSVGLIHLVLLAAEIIERTVREATGILVDPAHGR